MENTASTDLLFSSGVLTERGDDVTLSTRFESSIDEYEAEIPALSREELSRLIRERVGSDANVEPLIEIGGEDPRTIAELCALSDRLDTAPADWLQLLPVLRLFRTDDAPTEGVPEPFVPVPGEIVPHLAAIYSRLLVYVWLDDCPPCDALADRLESIFERPRGVLLFAVYGPAYRDVLEREYDVTAGPVLLFMRDGAVDSRLYGDHAESVIETEVDRFLD